MSGISKFMILASIKNNANKANVFARTMTTSNVEAGKKAAAYHAVDLHIQDRQVVGIGSGSTIAYAVKRIAERVKNEKLNLICVPTSFQSKQLICDNRLTLGDLENNPEIDVVIDGADEVDDSLTLIKGGGGCLTQEKIVAHNSNKMVIVADQRKNSKFLGDNWNKGIPVEVMPFAYVPIQRQIEKMYGGEAKLRMATAKADNLINNTASSASIAQGPVVTDNGNFLIDWHFKEPINWADFAMKVKLIPGVVETGLFLGMAEKAYFGLDDGEVRERGWKAFTNSTPFYF